MQNGHDRRLTVDTADVVEAIGFAAKHNLELATYLHVDCRGMNGRQIEG